MTASADLREFAYTRLCIVRDDEAGDAALLEALTPDQRQQAYAIASRRLAMQLLFEIDQAGGENALERVLLKLDSAPDLGPIQRERVEAMVRGAWADRREADSHLLELAPGWPATRQPAVDRAILRLARYEMRSGLNPVAIVINEAVELARRFSTEKSPSFINGVLGKMTPGAAASAAQGE